jgi:fumarylpyruvate hydrolase
MDYVIAPPPPASLAIDGTSDRFAVRRIFCVGRNYSAHVREMGADTREAPFFFCKPADALVDSASHIPFPMACTNLHHEAELVVALGRGGVNIAPQTAPDHVWGYAAGIDLTRRDMQAAAKAARRPWDMAKGFDRSAPCGALVAASRCGHLAQGHIRLSVNGDIRQDADLSDMIWPVPQIITHLSRLVALAPGDLIFTGTPAGVGPVVAGDRLRVEIAGLPELTLTVG